MTAAGSAILKAWAIVSPQGIIDEESCRDNEEYCWSDWCREVGNPRGVMEAQGYYCVQVEIRESVPPAQDAGLLRECRDAIFSGLETEGRHEPAWSKADRKLVARIDAHLANAAQL